jgi:hypothetical protein
MIQGPSLDNWGIEGFEQGSAVRAQAPFSLVEVGFELYPENLSWN